MLIELQEALYNKLTDTGLTVFDTYVTADSMPYVIIDVGSMSQLDCKTDLYASIQANIHIFSDYVGSLEIKTIIANVIDCLNNISIGGGHVITSQRLNNVSIITETENYNGTETRIIKHAVITYDFKII